MIYFFHIYKTIGILFLTKINKTLIHYAELNTVF